MPDPYEKNLVTQNFYYSKTDIIGRIVVVLDGTLEKRGLQLIQPPSRAFPAGTIIELIGTDETSAGPGEKVEKIAYLAFVELQNGGVLLSGDPVIWNGRTIGTIAGFDDTHMPNHQNTIVTMETRSSGAQLGCAVGDEIIIQGFTSTNGQR
ncbi:MAG: hypothetical protein WCX28_08315 [Bacteriovoracaceae bacterium]|nr:hypothetical protein [Bacteroidota bacterium]